MHLHNEMFEEPHSRITQFPLVLLVPTRIEEDLIQLLNEMSKPLVIARGFNSFVANPTVVFVSILSRAIRQLGVRVMYHFLCGQKMIFQKV
jgi:hypothetical protein